jgi:hypothetical protein
MLKAIATAQTSTVEQSQELYDGYTKVSAEVLAEIAGKYAWIAEPIQRASNYVRNMPFFEFIEGMTSPHEFKGSAMQLYYHSATFPKVMGLMLGMTPLSENHMMSFYAEHASGEATHHQMLLDWMLKHRIVDDFDEIKNIITTPETNACVNLAYQMAVEQDRDKWLVALNCGIERCSNDFFKVVAPKSAVFPILRRVAASRTVSPFARSAFARSSLSAVTTGLRPPRRPRAAAAERPARVRSRMRSRSNWPSAPNT